MWLFKVNVWENAFPQTSHLNGRSPVWTRLCLLLSEDLANFLPHTSQVKGLTPLWVLRWTFKLLICLKLIGQIPHWNFCFGCAVSICSYNSDLGSLTPQFLTRHETILLWTKVWCWFKSCLERKLFPHSVHLCCLNALWPNWCRARSETLLKAMGQISQKCFLSGWSSRRCWYKSFTDRFKTGQCFILHWKLWLFSFSSPKDIDLFCLLPEHCWPNTLGFWTVRDSLKVAPGSGLILARLLLDAREGSVLEEDFSEICGRISCCWGGGGRVGDLEKCSSPSES